MIKAFTYQSKPEEVTCVTKLLTGLVNEDFKLYPCPQYWPDKVVEPGDNVICFGQTLETGMKAFIEDKGIPVNVLFLPAPKKLLPVEGNEEAREKAWINSLAFIESIKRGMLEPKAIRYTDDDLPELDRRHILMLQAIMEKSGNKYCIQTTKNGKRIVVGDNVPPALLGDMKADITITFHELYTIRNLMDILGVKEVDLLNLPESAK